MAVQCSICGKHFLGQLKKLKPRNPIYAHIKGTHRGKGHPVAIEEEEEESMASRHIQATLDEAMGVENFDREWLI